MTIPPVAPEKVPHKNQQLEELMKAMQQEHNYIIKTLITQKRAIKKLSSSNKRLQTSLHAVACQTHRATQKNAQLLANIDDTCKGRNGTVPAFIAYHFMNKTKKQARELEQYKKESKNTQSPLLPERNTSEKCAGMLIN